VAAVKTRYRSASLVHRHRLAIGELQGAVGFEEFDGVGRHLDTSAQTTFVVDGPAHHRGDVLRPAARPLQRAGGGEHQRRVTGAGVIRRRLRRR